MRTVLLSFTIALCCVLSAWANGGLRKIETLDEIDFSARKVQFRNIATGQYIVLAYNSSDNAYLKGGYEEQLFWNFTVSSSASTGQSLEILMLGDETSRWLNKRTSGQYLSQIILGKKPSTANSLWNLYSVSPGIFRITDAITEESIELKPNMDDRLMTQPTKTGNDYQLWEIYTDKKKNDIIVARAIWESGEKEEFVTKKIRELVAKGVVKFEAKNKVLGSSLYTGQRKKLTIIYKKNGAVYTKVCLERDIFEF